MEESKMMEQVTEAMEEANLDVTEMPPMEVSTSSGGAGKVALIAGAAVLVGTGIVLGVRKGKKWLNDRKAKKMMEVQDEEYDEFEEDVVEEVPEKETK